jgi:putative effector of murein hydrolase LrgA (UPF0299 family)
MRARSAGKARIAAWTICTSTIVLIVLALVGQLRSSGAFAGTGDAGVVILVQPVISALVGAVIIDRKGSHMVGWLFCLSSLAWGVSFFGSTFSELPLLAGLPWESRGAWVATWTIFLAFGSAPVLVLFVFPTGDLISSRWKGPFGIGAFALAIGVLGSALAPGPLEDRPEIVNPFGATGTMGEVFTHMREAAWPLLLLAIAAGAWSLRVRMRRGTSEERQQIKWISLAGMVLLVFVLVWGFTEMTGGDTSTLEVLNGLVLLLLPLSVGIAILRHRLYDIDRLINRTLVYAALSVMLGLGYAGAVVLLQRLLSPVTSESDLAIAASTLAVAGAFRPLRTRTQGFIDRRFYRRRYDAVRTVGEFSARMRDQVDLESVRAELVGAVGATIQPAHVSLWLRIPEETR